MASMTAGSSLRSAWRWALLSPQHRAVSLYGFKEHDGTFPVIHDVQRARYCPSLKYIPAWAVLMKEKFYRGKDSGGGIEWLLPDNETPIFTYEKPYPI